MSARRAALLLVLIGGGPHAAGAQWSETPSFGGGTVMVGAQGFARPPITSGVAAAYAHVPVHAALLLGAQGGTKFREPERSHASYVICTIAYTQRRGVLWQAYPFVGAGGAALHTRPGDVAWKPAFAAGFGIDVLSRADSPATMLGARMGYLTRSMADDESIAYVAVGFGFGGRRVEPSEPRPVAVR